MSKESVLATIIIAALLAIPLAASIHAANNTAQQILLDTPPELPATIYGNVTITCTSNATSKPAPPGLNITFLDAQGQLLASTQTGNGTSQNNSYIAQIQGYTGTVQVYVERIHVANITVAPGDIVRLDIAVNDTNPPTAPVLTTRLNDTNLTISWQRAEDDLGVDHYEYVVLHNGSLLANGSTLNTSITITALPDGFVNVTVSSIDLACNENSSSVLVIVDTRPPRIIPESWPADGSIVLSGGLTLQVIVVDQVSGLGQATLYVDSTPAPVNITQVNSTAWRITANLTLTDGPHTLELVATDDSGNAAWLRTNITVDTAPPTLELVEGPTNTWTNKSPVAYVFRASDNGAGVNWSSAEASAVNASVTSITVDPATGNITVTVEPGPGNFTVTLKIGDIAGRQSTLTVEAGYDPEPPLVEILSPADGSTVSSSNVTILASISDNLSGVNWDSVTAWIDGYGNLTLTIDPANGTVQCLATLPDGSYTVHIIARDNTGNTAHASAIFTVDTGAPQITVSGVANGGYTNATSIDVTVSASDPQGIAWIIIELDGETVATCNCTGNTTETLSTTLSGLAEGTHTLNVTASDTAGNKARYTAVFTVDTTPPQISVASPAEDEYYSTSTLTLEALVEDARVARVVVYLDGQVLIDTQPGTGTVSITQDLGPLSDGSHTLAIKAWDAAGNKATVTVNFTVDTTPPVIAGISPGNGQILGTSTVDVIVVVNEASTITVTALLDGEPISLEVTGQPGQWTASATLELAGGWHSLQISVQDAAGNHAGAEVSFAVDLVPPQVAIDEPVDGAWLNASQVQLSAEASDDIMLDSASVYVDGEHYTDITLEGTTSSITISIEGLTDGSHAIELVVYDSAGHQASTAVTITIDTVPPAVASVYPVPGSALNTSTLTIRFVLEEDNQLSATLIIDGEPVEASVSPTGQGEWLVEYTGFLGEGEHTAVLKAWDPAGNSVQAGTSFIVDTTPPAITIVSPAPGSMINTENVTIEAELTDSLSGVYWQAVQVLVDGVAVPYSYDPVTGALTATLTLGEGQHTLEIVASDHAGNKAAASSVFTVSLGAPSVAISPEGTVYTSSGVLNITVTASDDTGLDTIIVVLDGETVYSCSCQGEQNHQATISVGPLSEGTHTLNATATDTTGKSSTATLVIVADYTAPQVVILEPADGLLTNSSTVTLQASVSDENGISNVTVLLNGEPVPYNETPDGIVAAINLDEGQNTITVKATDIAGNAASQTIRVTLDTYPPSLSIVGSLPEATNQSTIQVTIAVADNILVDSVTITTPAGEVVVNVSQPSAVIEALVPLAPGQNTIVIEARDKAGNRQVETASIVMDPYPPTITVIEAPPPLGNNTAIELVATLTDNLTSIETVNVLLDNSPVDYTLNGSTLTVTVQAGEGEHTLIIEARDSAGNKASATVVFTIDTRPPILTVETPLYVNTTDITITIAASDEPAGIRVIEILVDGSSAWSEQLDNASSITTTASISLTSEGTHTLTIIAIDAAGNTNATILTITLDTTPPTILVNPADGAIMRGPNVTLAAQIMDPHLAPNAVVVMLDNVTVNASILPGNGSVTAIVNASINTPGPHILTVIARDLAGNLRTVTVTLLVDLEPPAIDAPRLAVIDGPGSTVAARISDDLLQYVPATSYNITLEGASLVRLEPDGTVILEPLIPSGNHLVMVTLAVVDPAGRTASTVIYVAVGREASTRISLEAGRTMMLSIPFYTVPDLLDEALEECNATITTVSPAWELLEALTGAPVIAIAKAPVNCTLDIQGYVPPDAPPALARSSGPTGLIIPLAPVNITDIIRDGAVYELDEDTGQWILTIVDNGTVIGPSARLDPGRVYLTYRAERPALAPGAVPADPRENNQEPSGLHAGIIGAAGLSVLAPRRRRGATLILGLLAATPLLAYAAEQSSAEVIAGPPSHLTTETGIVELSIVIRVHESSQTILAVRVANESGVALENITVSVDGEPQQLDNLTLLPGRATAVYNSLTPPTGNVTITLTLRLSEPGSYTVGWRVMLTTVRGMLPDLPLDVNGTVTVEYVPPPGNTTTQPSTSPGETPESNTTSPPATTTPPAGVNTTRHTTQPSTLTNETSPAPEPPAGESGGLPGAAIAALALVVVAVAAAYVLARKR